MDLFDKCRDDLEPEKVRAMGIYPYFRVIDEARGPLATIEGREIIMMGSNNYLGLTTHPQVKEAAKRAIDKYGTGCTGSRFLNGTMDIHVELEAKLARFFNKEAALLFSTGYQANVGAISALVGRRDAVFYDAEDHASIISGLRLTFGKHVRYRHSDMAELEAKLEEHAAVPGKLIITDGLFSMSGDIANLPAIAALAKRYNAKVYVDDAHSIGVLGKHGRGTGEHFKMESAVDILMGTFSKSFASLGGIIAGEKTVIDYIKHRSRPFIFHASMPPPNVAAVAASLEILQSDPGLLEKLWRNTKRVRDALNAMGYNTLGSQTPIIPLVIGDEMATLAFAFRLFQRGVFTNPAIAPAVPPGHGMIRVSLMATHTDEIIDRGLAILEDVGKEMGVLNGRTADAATA